MQCNRHRRPWYSKLGWGPNSCLAKILGMNGRKKRFDNDLQKSGKGHMPYMPIQPDAYDDRYHVVQFIFKSR